MLLPVKEDEKVAKKSLRVVTLRLINLRKYFFYLFIITSYFSPSLFTKPNFAQLDRLLPDRIRGKFCSN